MCREAEAEGWSWGQEWSSQAWEALPTGARLSWQPTSSHCGFLALLILSVIKDVPQFHQYKEFLMDFN